MSFCSTRLNKFAIKNFLSKNNEMVSCGFLTITITIGIGIVLAAPRKETLNYDDPELGPYIEGDILQDLPHVTRQGLTDEYYRWPNALLFYSVSDDFDDNQKDLVQRALAEISSQTCIRFEQRTNQTDYVQVVKPSSGCSSHLGRQGGRQDLNVADSCFEITEANVYGFGKVAHEFIHALGFHHEHTRIDRDDFVTIYFDKIDPAYVDNFIKSEPPEYAVYNVTYDYGSVMHYPKVAFPKVNETETIVPHKDENGTEPVIGQRKGLSPTDFAKLNAMYNC